jgi:AGCS family alanine or glycine:cation symporter
LAGFYVLFASADQIPTMLMLILTSAFSTQEATGAFVGGTAGFAFLFGMKRALFSNEAGQGSSPIAHSAAKTDEPVREAVVAGLEPFIDTIVVCTFTALVILSTGIWNRSAEAYYDPPPAIVPVGAAEWSLETLPVPERIEDNWRATETVFVVLRGDPNPQSGNRLHRLDGRVVATTDGLVVEWPNFTSNSRPELDGPGLYATYVGATLTAKAFDSVTPGLGKWLVTLAVWLFAVSTMISWSYYGEQGIIYLFGERFVLTYKLIYCALILVATWGFIETATDLDNLTGIGTGVMLFANIPIMWVFGSQAMRAYHEYMARLDAGRLGPDHPAPSLEDLISGRDVDPDSGR